MIWLAVPFMAWLSRMCGGGRPKLPWGLDAWLLCAPYLLFYPVIGWWIVPAYLGAVLGVRLGHGSGFNYWQKLKTLRTVEKIEKIISGALSYHAQKVLIMLFTGLAVTLVLGVALVATGHYLSAGIIALSGAAKAIAYLLPRTEWAEIARGVFLGVGVRGGIMVL